MSDYPTLKFANPLIDRILSGEKRCTFRLGLDSDIQEGEPCWLCDSDGEKVVLKRIESIENMTIKKAANSDIEHHKSYVTTEKLVDAMGTYYPDREVHEYTRIDVVKWK